MKMSNKVYDILKWVAQIAIPAIATLCITICGIWNLPYTEQIVGSLTALDTFLGVILGISNAKYKKQSESVDNEEDDSE